MDKITRAQRHIDKLEPAVSGSGGHAATYRACRILVNDYQLSTEEAWPILLTYNERCEPPWNEKTLRRKLEDAARRPAGNHGTDKSQGQKKQEPVASLPPSKRIATGQAKYNPPPKAPTGPPPVPQLDAAMIASLAEKGAQAFTRFFLGNISATDPALVTPDTYLRALFDVDRGEKTLIFSTRAPYAYFDNLRGKLQSTCLESFISSVSQDIRPFHTQSLVTKQNCAIVIITGNSLEWNTDLAARLLICDLNLTDSNPQDRTVQRVIDLETIQDPGNRAELLACLNSFVRHWIEQKRPTPDKTRAGFQRTSSIIAGIVSLLGIGEPFGDRPDEIYGGGDQNLQDMRDLVQTAVDLLKPGETYGEIKWDDIISICIERNSFESLIDARTEYVTETDENGNESKTPRYKLTQASNKRFSFLLNSTYGGKTFKLKDGRIVKWDSRGKKRSKKYTFQIS